MEQRVGQVIERGQQRHGVVQQVGRRRQMAFAQHPRPAAQIAQNDQAVGRLQQPRSQPAGVAHGVAREDGPRAVLEQRQVIALQRLPRVRPFRAVQEVGQRGVAGEARLPVGGVDAGQRGDGRVGVLRLPRRRREVVGHVCEDHPAGVAVHVGVVTGHNARGRRIAQRLVDQRLGGVGLLGDEGDGVGTTGQGQDVAAHVVGALHLGPAGRDQRRIPQRFGVDSGDDDVGQLRHAG